MFPMFSVQKKVFWCAIFAQNTSFSERPGFAYLATSYPPIVSFPFLSGVFVKNKLNIGLISSSPPTPPSAATYSTKDGILPTSLFGPSPIIPLNLSLSISVASFTERKVAPRRQDCFGSSLKHTLSRDTAPETQPCP